MKFAIHNFNPTLEGIIVAILLFRPVLFAMIKFVKSVIKVGIIDIKNLHALTASTKLVLVYPFISTKAKNIFVIDV